MRISGGLARGINLLVPKGDLVRPATDAMRQAVFSSLANFIPGARFLDLFAGSGGYGLEALSRGAAGGVFVEKNPKAIACLRQNLAAVAKSIGRDPSGVEIRQADAVTSPIDAGLDIIFLDPPYEIIPDVAPALFGRFAEALAPKADALVVFEAPGELQLSPPGWTCLKRLGKGVRQPTVSIFRADRASP